MISLSLTIGYGLIGTAIVLTLFRALKGPSLADRIVALDLTAGLALAACALMAIDSGQSHYLDIAIVIALLAFMGTVAFARYLERHGSKS